VIDPEFIEDERNPNLDVFDEAYYASEEFYSLQQSFIRQNIERFFD